MKYTLYLFECAQRNYHKSLPWSTRSLWFVTLAMAAFWYGAKHNHESKKITKGPIYDSSRSIYVNAHQMSSTLCHESAANIRPLIVVQPLKITSSICLHLTCIHHNKILESISNFQKNIWKWSFLSQTESVYWIFQISNFQSLIMSKIRVF